MDHIGIDVHKKGSQICILAEGGELIERRIPTQPRRFAEERGERAPARILLESSTESEWVARCLEGLGHEVIVADPNFAPMDATRTRTVKTDRRDARALAEAGRHPLRAPTRWDGVRVAPASARRGDAGRAGLHDPWMVSSVRSLAGSWVGERAWCLGRRPRAVASMAPPPLDSPQAPASVVSPRRERE